MFRPVADLLQLLIFRRGRLKIFHNNFAREIFRIFFYNSYTRIFRTRKIEKNPPLIQARKRFYFSDRYKKKKVSRFDFWIPLRSDSCSGILEIRELRAHAVPDNYNNNTPGDYREIITTAAVTPPAHWCPFVLVYKIIFIALFRKKKKKM